MATKKLRALSGRTVAGQFISLRNVKGKADQFYINVGVPRTIDIKELRWDKDEMVTARMGPQEFDILSSKSYYISNIKPPYPDHMDM